MNEHTWYQVQFLNAKRTYEDCFDGVAKTLDEAKSLLRQKRRYFGKNYRIVERKEIERVVLNEECES